MKSNRKKVLRLRCFITKKPKCRDRVNCVMFVDVEEGKPILTDFDKEALRILLPEYKWLACDKNGVVYAHAKKPLRDDGLGVWQDRHDNSLFLINKAYIRNLFTWCNWDDEPQYIPDLLKY